MLTLESLLGQKRHLLDIQSVAKTRSAMPLNDNLMSFYVGHLPGFHPLAVIEGLGTYITLTH